jgi:hypothetical protein
MNRLIVFLLLGSLLFAAGCVTETSTNALARAPSPKLRNIAPAPQSAPINELAILKSMRPVDTNGNGYPNRLDVSVYLFSRPYPVPRFANGALVFSLYPPKAYDSREGFGAEPIAQWRFGEERMLRARFKNVVGQGYALSLDLNEIGISSLEYNSADLVTTFEPANGTVLVHSDAVQTIPYMH